MYCSKCGKEISNDSYVCLHCGVLVKDVNEKQCVKELDSNKSKIGLGVLFALLIGLIGLAFCIAMYPEDSVARITFFKGWLITFVITCSVVLFVSLIFIIVVFA